jgi:hypothetical protein
LSGVLTGLNGVVLAKQIGRGASNEEKAATADMMMTEATSAGGHVVSLGLAYGPGFMKGFKNASKGVIGRLFAGVKNKLGTFAVKTLGPVSNWAKNVGYKLGFGLAEKTGEGLLSKAWKAPGTLLEKTRNIGIIKKFNNSDFSKSLKAKAAKIDNIGWVNKVDIGEKLGEGFGNWGENAGAETRIGKLNVKADAWKTATETELDEAVGKNAGRDAGNRTRAKIEHDITKSREFSNNQIADNRTDDGFVPQENVDASKAARRHADNLERSEEKVVSNTEKKTAEETAAEHAEKRKDKPKEEAEEKKQIEEFNKDPKKYHDDTKFMEVEIDAAKTRAKSPNVTQDERKKALEVAEQLRHEADERQLIAIKAGGGEAPETLWDVKKQGMEAWSAWHHKNETAEKVELATKDTENRAGGHADTEKREKAEQKENIAEWSHGEAPELAVYEHVEGMLEGLDEDDEHEGDEHESDEPQAGDAKTDDAGNAGDAVNFADIPNASFEPAAQPSQAPAQASNDNAAPVAASAPGAGAGSEAPPPPSPAPVAAPAPASGGGSPEDKLADVPELVYWPNLTGDNGEFAKSAKEMFRMKQIAYAFQRAQLEARKKALETVATLATSTKDADLKQAQAMDHSLTINGTVEEANKASASANQGTQQAGEGAKQQGTGQGNSDTKAQGKVEIGDKPSRWHPIKRLWWYVKKWASEAAAKVFGWIQNKIASLVLRGLCGVSMDDMRDYTTALHHRMEFSKMVGQQGQTNAKKTMDAALNTKKVALSDSAQALEDAKECDKNVADAGTFIQDVESTEQDLQKQQAAAKQFLAELAVAVALERAQKQEAKQKQAADAAKAQPTAGAASAAASAVVAPKPAPVAARVPTSKKKKPAEPKEKKVSVAAVSKVQKAASYVTSQTSIVIQQLTASKEEQARKLRSTFENKKAAQPIIAKLKTGDNIIANAQTQTRQVSDEMAEINSMSPANANALHGQAAKIKSGARELDELAKDAHEQLNWAFKLSYDKVKKVPAITAYL